MTGAAISAVRYLTRQLDFMGRSIEAIPGWHRLDRFINQTLDDLAWGFSVAVGALWLLRWWIALVIVVLVVT